MRFGHKRAKVCKSVCAFQKEEQAFTIFSQPARLVSCDDGGNQLVAISQGHDVRHQQDTHMKMQIAWSIYILQHTKYKHMLALLTPLQLLQGS